MQSTLEGAPEAPAPETQGRAPLIIRPTGVQTFLQCPR